jgi:hypothetical protein
MPSQGTTMLCGQKLKKLNFSAFSVICFKEKSNCSGENVEMFLIISGQLHSTKSSVLPPVWVGPLMNC